MKTIWKFAIDIEDTASKDLPAGAQVIHVRAFGQTGLWLWAIVDPDAPRKPRTFHVRGTGHPLGDVGAYIGTVEADPFVWHVFEAAALAEGGDA